MNVVKSLQKVLDTIIVPMYPQINHVIVSTFGSGDLPYYRVIYILNDGLEQSDLNNITAETESLFKMTGPKNPTDIIIKFEFDFNT